VGLSRFAFFIAFAITSTAALAQIWPAKPVRLVIGFPPGTPPEVIGRMLADKFTAALGQAFVVENRPGAAGTIAANAVAQSAPDGYTLMVGVAANLAVAPHLLPSAAYNPGRAFEPIGFIQRGPYFIVVRSDLPVSSLQELIAYSKANPQKLNFATPGMGTVHHLTWELLMMRTGAALTHVPQQGGAQMVAETLGGRTHAFMENAASPVVANVRAGKLKLLATTAERRVSLFPEIATAAEQGVPGVEAYSWWGLVGPAGMPREIVQRMNAELNRALSSPDMVERLKGEGVPDDMRITSTPEEFGRWVSTEYERWGRVIKEAGVKLQ
jgi:tripartite-type tricarboxylate transporter receptor subunit TctC